MMMIDDDDDDNDDDGALPAVVAVRGKVQAFAVYRKKKYIILKYICIYLIIIWQCVKTLYPW